MEIDISKSNNLISFDKKKNSILENDSILYSTSNTGNPEEAYHIEHSKFLNLNLNLKDLKLSINDENDENLFIFSNEGYLFSMFFNYLKVIYIMNLKNSKNQIQEDIKFNIKEYRTNLKQYARNEVFLELLNNLNKKSQHFNLILEIISTKFSSF